MRLIGVGVRAQKSQYYAKKTHGTQEGFKRDPEKAQRVSKAPNAAKRCEIQLCKNNPQIHKIKGQRSNADTQKGTQKEGQKSPTWKSDVKNCASKTHTSPQA